MDVGGLAAVSQQVGWKQIEARPHWFEVEGAMTVLPHWEAPSAIILMQRVEAVGDGLSSGKAKGEMAAGGQKRKCRICDNAMGGC